MLLTTVLSLTATHDRRFSRERTSALVGGAAQQAQLVERSRRGDAAAFAALVDSVERVALSVAFGVVGDAGAAGDVVQDALLRAWQRLGDLKEPAKFSPWLCGIVRNLAIDVARARAVRATAGSSAIDASDPVDAVTPGPLEELNRQEEHGRLAAALARLDEISRSALVLRYYEGLSSREIGQLIGLAPTAVDMRLMRARRQLREHLERRNDEPACAKHGSDAGASTTTTTTTTTEGGV